MTDKKPSPIIALALNQATFHNVLVDNLSFVNLFFGNNGTGKSTIAKAIMDNEGIAWAEGESSQDYDVIVFNRGFIEANLSLQEGLKGVYTIGEENIEAKNKIQSLQRQKTVKSNERVIALDQYMEKKSESENASNQFQNDCFRKGKSLRERFPDCFVGKKQKKTFAEAVLAQAPACQDMSSLERLYDAAYGKTSKIYPEFKKVRQPSSLWSHGKALLEQEIVVYGNTRFTRFIASLGPGAVDWVHHGHLHYARDGKCPYCQQELPLGFEEQLGNVFNVQYQQAMNALGKFQSDYARQTQDIENILKSNTLDVMDSLCLTAYQEKLSMVRNAFEVNRQRIAEKRRIPSKVVALVPTDDLIEAINGIIDGINDVIGSHNRALMQKSFSQSVCQVNVLSHLAYVLAKETSDYRKTTQRLDKEIEDIVKHGRKIKAEIEALSIQITELSQRNANTRMAMDNINTMLKESGFQGFSIRVKEENENMYEIVRDNGAIAENLSDGERGFLAFLYFFQQVSGSMDAQKQKPKIVVIDDPLFGMDRDASSIVTTLTKKMIKDCLDAKENNIRQLFLLTHDSDFYNEVADVNGSVECMPFFTIRKNDNSSMVEQSMMLKPGKTITPKVIAPLPKEDVEFSQWVGLMHQLSSLAKKTNAPKSFVNMRSLAQTIDSFVDMMKKIEQE